MLLAEHKPDAVSSADIFLVALSRFPPTAARESMLAAIAEVPVDNAEQRRLIYEDIIWSLLSTREFLFNH